MPGPRGLFQNSVHQFQTQPYVILFNNPPLTSSSPQAPVPTPIPVVTTPPIQPPSPRPLPRSGARRRFQERDDDEDEDKQPVLEPPFYDFGLFPLESQNINSRRTES